MRRIILIWITMLLVVLVGCSKLSDDDKTVLQKFVDVGAEWFTEAGYYVDCYQLEEDEVFPLDEDRFVQVTKDSIVTEQAEVNYAESYGELRHDIYVIVPNGGSVYVLLETQISGLRYDVLLYRISGNEIVLCQVLFNAYLDEMSNSYNIVIEKEALGLARTDGLTQAVGVYCLNTQNDVLELAEGEKINYSEECVTTVRKEELPVTMNGMETSIPVGTKIRFLQNDLKGTYYIRLEETGETAEIHYETDEYGRIYVGDKSASCYFKYAILITESKLNLKEKEAAIAKAGEDGEIAEREFTVQGELYNYRIQEMHAANSNDIPRWFITIYEGDNVVQKIEQVRVLGVTTYDEERIWEADVNFDGRMDVIVRSGQANLGEPYQNNCYLGNDDGTFTECPSFFEIKAPWIDEENQVIHDYNPQEDYRIEKIYQYNGSEFIVIESIRYEKDEDTQEWVLKEEYTREDCVTFDHLLSAEGLSEADKTELQRFAAVFDDDTQVHLYEETEELLLPFQQVPNLYGVDTPGFLFLQDYTLADVTADGKKDLIMRFSDIGGSVFVVCEENGEYYMSYNSVRQMQIVYENGWHLGSGGAGTYVYSQLRFENGKFWEETIALHDARTVYVGNDEYEVLFDGHVNEQPVTLEEFKAWEAENVGNEVSWYAVDMGE